MKNFYLLYQHFVEFTPQVVEQLPNRPQLGDKLIWDIFSVPWGHHKVLIDKCSLNPSKALFFCSENDRKWIKDVKK